MCVFYPFCDSKHPLPLYHLPSDMAEVMAFILWFLPHYALDKAIAQLICVCLWLLKGWPWTKLENLS